MKLEEAYDEQITRNNYLQMLQWGCINGDYVQSMLRSMLKHHGPTFFHNPNWTECILDALRSLIPNPQIFRGADNHSPTRQMLVEFRFGE
jgi:hypothetical protein